MAQALLTPPPQDHALQGSADALQQYQQPILAPQSYQDDLQAPFSGGSIQPYSIAAPNAPHIGMSNSAMQCTPAVETTRQVLLADGMQLQSHIEPSSMQDPAATADAAGLQLNGVMQPTLHARAAQIPEQVLQPTVTAGHLNTGKTAPHSAEVTEHMQTGSGEVAVVSAVASAPVKTRFGGILSGVVREAAETATKRPPVFRYEDFKMVSCPHPP